VEPLVQALEAQYLDELLPTHDAAEGIAAWLEKRAPRWQDR
jgi:enoyl-CoA hydratase/carnithine racemase